MAMLNNLLTSLIKHERIVTTTPRAYVLKPYVEKVITYGKKSTVHHRNLAARRVKERAMVVKLFGVIAPRYEGRDGGYTRVLKLSGRRKGDGADMSVIELVDREGEIRAAKKVGRGEDGIVKGEGIGKAYREFKRKQGKGRHPGLDWLW